MLTEHFPPDGNKILNVASENFRAKILNIEFLRSRILDIDPSVLISIFGVMASSVRARRVACGHAKSPPTGFERNWRVPGRD